MPFSETSGLKVRDGCLYLFMAKKRILVAPLNWGLGHATRCIPIIQNLIEEGFEPVIASDGDALHLLKTEFSSLESYELPSYNIKYSSSAFFFRSKLILQIPHILKTITAEKHLTARLIKEKNINGIISDSRWGVRSMSVPSVFLTHQVNVLSGITSSISSFIHKIYIRKFDECWVPDNEGDPNLSGKMGHPRASPLNLKYIGILSRFIKLDVPVKYDIAVILSGPEPQRSLLEKKIKKEIYGKDLRTLIVRGVVEGEQECFENHNLTTYNFLSSEQLCQSINQSTLVICRPGYTSLMDLVFLQKKVFLILTPGQYEQEYLFKRLLKKGLIAGCIQSNFRVELLEEVKDAHLGVFETGYGLDGIFTLFKGK